jgi:hypothetical protein
MGRLKREGVKLLKPNIINMNVHSATCSCSIDLDKLWYTLVYFGCFLVEQGHFAGFSVYFVILSEKLRWAGRGTLYLIASVVQ